MPFPAPSRGLLPLLLATVLACGPAYRTEIPGEGTSGTLSHQGPEAAPERPAFSGREILVGEMCPVVAAGRPAVVPIIALRSSGWVDEIDELSYVVERQWARSFSVLGWDGRRIGLFSVAGGAGVAGHPAVAIGAYAGGSPCEQPPGTDGKKRVDPACVAAQSECGLAVAELEPSAGIEARPLGETAPPLELSPGAVCIEDGELFVDLDGDGRHEVFPIEAFVDGSHAPADEVLALGEPREASCKESFSVRHAVPPSGDEWRGLDILGVLDIDGDGRHELLLVYHYADRRTWALYSAPARVVRLELVARGAPWSTR